MSKLETKLPLPVFGPIIALLRSRKFLIAAITLVVDVLITQVPALEPVRTELITVFTLLGSLLVAAIAYEDGQRLNGKS